MAEADGERFEAKLERQFSRSPALADADLFALRVSDTLNRGWTVRGALIGALGVAGGMVLVVQVASSGAIARAQALSNHSGAAIGRALGHVLPSQTPLAGLPFAGAVIWIPVALAVVAIGYAVLRGIREI
jgi:hypothetical protein